MTHRIIDVKALEDFVVLVIFQNGVVKEYDVKIYDDIGDGIAVLKKVD